MKFFVFIGVFDGIVDTITVHDSEQNADQAYANFTGVAYENPITGETGPEPTTGEEPCAFERVSASTIEEVEIGTS